MARDRGEFSLPVAPPTSPSGRTAEIASSAGGRQWRSPCRRSRTMFQITLVDHVRLSFGSALAAYEGHTEAAAQLTRLTSYAKIALLGLSGLTAVFGAIAVGNGRGWQMATAVCAC